MKTRGMLARSAESLWPTAGAHTPEDQSSCSHVRGCRVGNQPGESSGCSHRSQLGRCWMGWRGFKISVQEWVMIGFGRLKQATASMFPLQRVFRPRPVAGRQQWSVLRPVPWQRRFLLILRRWWALRMQQATRDAQLCTLGSLQTEPQIRQRPLLMGQMNDLKAFPGA